MAVGVAIAGALQTGNGVDNGNCETGEEVAEETVVPETATESDAVVPDAVGLVVND
jgi:hypothetical protein